MPNALFIARVGFKKEQEDLNCDSSSYAVQICLALSEIVGQFNSEKIKSLS